MPLIEVSKTTSAILELKLNRPHKRNALSIQLMRELIQELDQIGSATRILILKGAGQFFCAGLDLDEAAESTLHEEASALVAETLQKLAQVPCCTLAIVTGGAMAGGLGLVAACDLVLACENAIFALPELKRGLIPALVSTLLKRQLLPRFLHEMVVTGAPVTAQKAQEIGMVNYLFEIGQEEKQSAQLIERILQSAPDALRFYKQFFIQPFNLKSEFQEALKQHRLLRKGFEAQEGIQAFLEKRPPQWK